MKISDKVLLASAATAGAGVVAWRTMFPWLEDDLKVIKVTNKIEKERIEAEKSLLIDKFEKFAAQTPNKPFIIFEDNLFSYKLVDEMACRVANIVRSWGLGPRDCVALMIHNSPAFVWTYLGLLKLGVTAALINHNLRMHPLINSILAANTKHVIVGAGDDLLGAITEVLDDLVNQKIYVQGLGSLPAPAGVCSLDPLLQMAFPAAVSPSVRGGLTLDDTCSYIYTSGTTGNPKPALVSHRRICKSSSNYICLTSLNSEDRYYVALPLFHSAAQMALGATIQAGATIVLKKKFSASQFWPDCRRHKVTVFHYIGELFRYLIAQPPNKLDAAHNVKVAIGNGIRKDIWLEVSKRFKIPLIAEFYGSTEGITSTFNVSNKPSAVGRLSPLLNILDRNAKALVKFDYATASPIRDKNGRCIKVGVGEPGLFIGKVPDHLVRNGEFQMYQSSTDANESKLVRDAFHTGDIYMNFGDVLMLDKDYFLYFQDRIGDTFRWKGENVSTTEVANAITALKFVHDANVYGVEVPGTEGRAGMAALIVNEGQKLGPKELKELYEHVCEELPTYARPLFVRLLDNAITTSTLKHQKFGLVKEGFDLNKVKDPLYYLDTENHTYSPLSASDLAKFLSSRL
ncbi:hypothetical protein BsWGS_00301 [Bradybaena similaris]